MVAVTDASLRVRSFCNLRPPMEGSLPLRSIARCNFPLVHASFVSKAGFEVVGRPLDLVAKAAVFPWTGSFLDLPHRRTDLRKISFLHILRYRFLHLSRCQSVLLRNVRKKHVPRTKRMVPFVRSNPSQIEQSTPFHLSLSLPFRTSPRDPWLDETRVDRRFLPPFSIDPVCPSSSLGEDETRERREKKDNPSTPKDSVLSFPEGIMNEQRPKRTRDAPSLVAPSPFRFRSQYAVLDGKWPFPGSEGSLRFPGAPKKPCEGAIPRCFLCLRNHVADETGCRCSEERSDVCCFLRDRCRGSFRSTGGSECSHGFRRPSLLRNVVFDPSRSLALVGFDFFRDERVEERTISQASRLPCDRELDGIGRS